MYLYILNTGLDIQENGPEKEINEQKLSQLCTGIILCNNINDDKKIIQAYDILKNFMFLNFFYNYIKTNKYSKKIQSNPDKYTFDDYFFNFLSFFNRFHNIKFILAPYEEAKGCGWSRNIILEKLYNSVIKSSVNLNRYIVMGK